MKILFTSLQYDEYRRERGHSFEYNNFYTSLVGLERHEARYLPFERALEVGKKGYLHELWETVSREKPDLLFVMMYTDELDPVVLSRIRRETRTKTLAWFSDDHWRWHNYSRFWAPHFDWVVTTYEPAVALYHRLGLRNIILSQWAANTGVYRPMSELPKNSRLSGTAPLVSFVGMRSKQREKIIRFLERRGVKVETYGSGWPNGRLTFQEMLWVFSNSKVNLALNTPNLDFQPKNLGRLIARRSRNRFTPDFHLLQNMRSFWCGIRNLTIKARHFEIPACGGFMISAMADNLQEYFKIGKEAVLYNDLDDLAEKVRHYLANNEARNSIAQAGYERVQKDHTYAARFHSIFKKIGLL